MLERSDAGKYAKSVFFEHINDLDVYIEDESDVTKKIFSLLIGRALGGTLSLSTVFPLGGKEKLVDRCWADQSPGGRRRVYIVDGDFSCIGNFSYPKLKRLFVLPCYCIENVLVIARGFAEIINEENPAHDFAAAQAAFNFTGWLTTNVDLLEKLFIAYAISQRITPDVATVSRKVSKFVSGPNGDLDLLKVETVVDEIRAGVDAVEGVGFFDGELLRLLHSRKALSAVNRIQIVSGKDYLLPLLAMRFRQQIQSKVTNSSLHIRLAKFADESGFGGIKTVAC